MSMRYILFIFLVFIVTSNLNAQEVEDNMRMVKPFKADGISNEWNEPLNEYNDATKLAFALANDDKNLYIVIESLDPQTTFSVLRGGITLNINTEGKKKKGINLVFPITEGQLSTENHDQAKGETPHSSWKGELSSDDLSIYKNIKISGFKNIPDGNLPSNNTSGIETGMSVNSNRDLIYELSIPLTQLQIDLDTKKPLMYNIKINAPAKSNFKRPDKPAEGSGRSGGMSRGGMGGGRGGAGGGGGRSGGMGGRGGEHPTGNLNSESKSSDFWIKFKLAKS
jgi:uncharacterized membrane protein YgcG